MTDQKQIQEEMDEMEKALEESEEIEDVELEDIEDKDNPPDNPPDKDDDPNPDLDKDPDKDKDKGGDKLKEKPKEPVEEDPRDIELKRLREENENLKKVPPKEEPKELPKDEPPKEEPISEENFLDGMDLDDLTRDPDLFNKVLNKVYMKGVEMGKGFSKKSVESIISTLPKVMSSTRSLEEKLQSINKQFYSDNEDLVPWQKSVAIVYDELAEGNPDKDYTELLPSVAQEVRRRLGLKEPEKKDDGDDKDTHNGKDKDDPPPPPKRGKSGQRQTTKPALSDFDKDSDEMDRALES